MRTATDAFTRGNLLLVLAVTTTLSALLFPVLVEARARQALRANDLTSRARIRMNARKARRPFELEHRRKHPLEIFLIAPE